ncbi:MAG: DUF167 domain-containing protein [Christensenellaceae bacterium]|jgi:uncharacterized protein (TIGR00251 family)|nr:DUF167 domain-containing protein [Christensenellaceae bacterium]
MIELFEIRVIPNASKNELLKTATGYKARLSASPIEGKANEALIALLSRELKIPKSYIEIIKGFKNKNKTIKINREI